MKAQELMTDNPASVRPEQSVREAAKMMEQHDCGCLPVVDKNTNKLIGVVTDRDIVTRAVATGKNDACVADVMTKDPKCARPDDDVNEIERIMAEAQVRRVPVVDDTGCVVGMISQADLALAVNGGGSDVTDSDVAEVIEEISKPTGAGSTF